MVDMKAVAEVVSRDDLPFGVMVVTRSLLELISRAVASERELNQALTAGLELSREVTALEGEVTALKRHLVYSESRQCKHSTKASGGLAGQVTGLLSQVKAMGSRK